MGYSRRNYLCRQRQHDVLILYSKRIGKLREILANSSINRRQMSKGNRDRLAVLASNFNRQKLPSNLLREVIAAFAQQKISGLGQPPPRTERIVPCSEDLVASCGERSQAPVREIILGWKNECRRDLIKLSRNSPHRWLIQRLGIRDNRDGVPCQRACCEGVDKGIPDLHSVLFRTGRSFSKTAATELGADLSSNFTATCAKKSRSVRIAI